MTLYEWLEKLEQIDPDDWGEIEKLRTTFSEDDLNTDLEAQITLSTSAGTIDRVTIQLTDESNKPLVNLDYEILQLDSVVFSEFLSEFVQQAVSPSK